MFSLYSFAYTNVMNMMENYIQGNLSDIAEKQGKPIKCGTFYNILIHQNWDKLNADLKSMYLKKINQKTIQDK